MLRNLLTWKPTKHSRVGHLFFRQSFTIILQVRLGSRIAYTSYLPCNINIRKDGKLYHFNMRLLQKFSQQTIRAVTIKQIRQVMLKLYFMEFRQIQFILFVDFCITSLSVLKTSVPRLMLLQSIYYISKHLDLSLAWKQCYLDLPLPETSWICSLVSHQSTTLIIYLRSLVMELTDFDTLKTSCASSRFTQHKEMIHLVMQRCPYDKLTLIDIGHGMMANCCIWSCKHHVWSPSLLSGLDQNKHCWHL